MWYHAVECEPAATNMDCVWRATHLSPKVEQGQDFRLAPPLHIDGFFPVLWARIIIRKDPKFLAGIIL
jgi:hypothetical protein